MNNKEKKPTSNKDDFRDNSICLTDLNEEEFERYNKEVKWFHNLGIAAPTRLIFEKIINDR